MTAPGESLTASNRLRTLVEFIVTGVCMLCFAFIALFFCVTQITGSTSGTRDYIVYWATGQQFAHHANPYDANALSKMEQAAGFPSGKPPMFMRNPPWALPLTLPLALFSSRVGSFLWSLMLLACLLISVHLLWRMQGRPKGLRHLLGYTFAPALACINTGQTSLLALLGLVLFLVLYRNRPFLAGTALWFCMLKPHLFLPFGVVLLAWIFVSRNYRVLAGAVAMLGASLAVTYFLDPMAWSQYAVMTHTSGMNQDFIPCLSFLLRNWISPHSLWIEFIPSIFGCAWALWYFWPRRHTWDWARDGGLLMLVSILVAPYSWIFDQVLAIPALLQGAYWCRSRDLLFALALASAAIEIAFLGDYWATSALYRWTLWTAPAWLAWYLAVCLKRSKPVPVHSPL
jgi:hypothetical protein